MYEIKGKTIIMTRGDTARIVVTITDQEGNPYEPSRNDTIRFAVKKNYSDDEPLFIIPVPINTLVLVIQPSDTKSLPFGDYVYDVQLTRANGDVDTFINKGTLRISEEVD